MLITKNTSTVLGQASTGPLPLRVAMADDDSSEHVLMTMAAREAEVDAQFLFFHSGEELLGGLRSIERRNELPEVIILDLRMPGIGGYGTMDELQADPILWAIPVVVLTSSTRDAERTLGLARGAQLFQNKPEDFSRLVSLARGLPLLAVDWLGVQGN